jgi:preprotein translocase subunit SecG
MENFNPSLPIWLYIVLFTIVIIIISISYREAKKVQEREKKNNTFEESDSGFSRFCTSNRDPTILN